MIVIGALVWGAALVLYAGLIAGLAILSYWLSARHKTNPSLPRHGMIQATLRAMIIALLLAPVILAFLYFPFQLVSADGTRELGVIKPRLVENLGIATLISFIAGTALAVIGVSIYSLTRSKPQVTS